MAAQQVGVEVDPQESVLAEATELAIVGVGTLTWIALCTWRRGSCLVATDTVTVAVALWFPVS